MAETLCSQLLMIKIAVYLFAQDQIASNCINVRLSKYILHVYYVCNPVAEGSHTEQSMALCRYLSHTVEACHVQQQVGPAYVTFRQLVRMHTLCKALCTCVYRKCQHIAEAIHRINTGKIILLIINYNYIIQWNLCQRSPEVGARLV